VPVYIDWRNNLEGSTGGRGLFMIAVLETLVLVSRCFKIHFCKVLSWSCGSFFGHRISVIKPCLPIFVVCWLLSHWLVTT